METICRRGAGRGIGVVLISQRSAALHKGCLSQTELMIAHQTTAPQDKEAIKEWVVDHGDEEQRESFLTRIPKLKTGTAIVWSPSWLEIYEEVAMRKKETYDSGDAPKVGQRRRAPKVLAQVDLERLKKHMSETIEKAKQEDPKLLRAEIQRLKAELSKKPESVLKAPPIVVQAVQVKDRIVEVPALKPGEIRKIRKLVESIEKIGSGLSSSSKSLETSATALSQAILKSINVAEANQKPQPAPARAAFMPAAQRIQPTKRAAAQISTQKNGDGGVTLIAGERKMLEVLAQFHPGIRTKSQLGSLSGYTPSGGTFGTYLSTLRKNGLIKEDRLGALSITDVGLDWFGGKRPKAPASTEELLEMWRGKLMQGERKMLDVLVERYPKDISKQELGELTGYTHTGGTFGTYLSTLRRNCLAITDDETVKASEALFELQSA
jgi:protein-arginine kinase activator protein McsA